MREETENVFCPICGVRLQVFSDYCPNCGQYLVDSIPLKTNESGKKNIQILEQEKTQCLKLSIYIFFVFFGALSGIIFFLGRTAKLHLNTAQSSSPSLKNTITLSPTQASLNTPVPSSTQQVLPISTFPNAVMELQDIIFISNRSGSNKIYGFQEHTITSLPLPIEYSNINRISFCGSSLIFQVSSYPFYSSIFYFWEQSIESLRPWIPLGLPNKVVNFQCSINGKFIAYIVRERGISVLLIASLKDNQIVGTHVIENDLASSFTNDLSWFWNEQKVIFTQFENDIYSITLSPDYGLGTLRHMGKGVSPVLSPDDKQLAFICQSSICLMDVQNQATLEIYDFSPDVLLEKKSLRLEWSIDGQWIYFSSPEDGDWDIYRIHPDGTGLENITYEWDSDEVMPSVRRYR